MPVSARLGVTDARDRRKPPARYDIDGFLKRIGDVPVTTDMQRVRLRSRDYFWYSPVLNKQLHGKTADIVATPRDEADVIASRRPAQSCASRSRRAAPRPAITGRRCRSKAACCSTSPTMTSDRMAEARPRALRSRAQDERPRRRRPGRTAGSCACIPRPSAWRRSAASSAGGSGGVGSVNYGGLREPGNILAARIVTVEEKPRTIELRADAAQKVNRAYGTTGIITALEMPLAPAWPWIDVIVTFDDFVEAVQFGLRGRARRRRREEADHADDLGRCRSISRR